MTVRFAVHPTRRFLLQVTVPACPSGMLVGPALIVESTLAVQPIFPAASACACNAARIFDQVPSRCQRRNRPYTVDQGA
ncbi:hypothetical protein GCM10020219_080370 [Nonomuraea dietziae]